MYADTSVLTCSQKNSNELQQFANHELLEIRNWFKINKLSINIIKTKFMTFSPEKNVMKLNYIMTKFP